MVEHQTEFQRALLGHSTSVLRKYQQVMVGNHSLFDLLRYGIFDSLFVPFPGALGILLRARMYGKWLGAMGKNVIWGRNVSIRHPRNIKVGNNVLIDDNCVLDAKGDGTGGITIGDNVMIGRNTIIATKNGRIEIGDNSNIATNCRIGTTSSLKVGKNVLIGGYTYITAGGEHKSDRTDIPIIAQGEGVSRGIVVDDNVWIGARVTVLDGVTVGRDSIIGACALVTRDIRAFVVAYGVPAKVVRSRK